MYNVLPPRLFVSFDQQFRKDRKRQNIPPITPSPLILAF